MEGIKRKILSLLMCIVVVVAGFNINVIQAEAADTITIDVTGLASGAETSHDCSKYLTSKYDSTQHWQQCTICGKIYGNKTNHSYKTYWAMGNSCSSNNKLVYSCSCGYSYKTNNTRSHTPLSTLSANAQYHVRLCSVCLEEIGEKGYHKDASGRQLVCTNTGVCATCGLNSTLYHEVVLGMNNGVYNNGKCQSCGKQVLTISSCSSSIKYSGTNFTVTEKIYLPNAASNVSVGEARFYVSSYGTITSSSCSYDANTHIATIVYKGSYSSGIESTQAITHSITYTGTDGVSYGIDCWDYITPEKTVPKITSVNQTKLSEEKGWTTNIKFSISGTENYCGSVKLTMKDSSGNVYLNNVSVPVSSNNWSYNFIPNIEADVNGKTFTVTATDTIGNSSSKTFTVYKTDKKAPTVTSANATSTNWSTSKSYTTKATDTGVGGVKIAFNNTNSYVAANQSSTTFSQNYIFTGDVYGSTTGAVYYKDALGNETTQFITISNIDNTAPTITNTSTECAANITLTVTANDNKDFGGSVGVKAGSGIAGYAVSKTNSTPSTFQTSNKLTITEDGHYYLFVKDNAGNIVSKDLGYLENTKAKVTVNHYFINKTTRNYPSTPTSTNVVYEEINSQYTAPIQQVSGYDLPDLKTVNISADGTTTVNYYYDVFRYTIYTYIDKGYGAISENQKVEPNQNTSVYYYPANGYDVEYVRYGTSNSNLTATPIDILKVFENVQSDYYFHVAYKITETKKSEIIKAAYNWINLKIN